MKNISDKKARSATEILMMDEATLKASSFSFLEIKAVNTGIKATDIAPIMRISKTKLGIRNAAKYGSSCASEKRAVSSRLRISPKMRDAATILAMTNAAERILVCWRVIRRLNIIEIRRLNTDNRRQRKKTDFGRLKNQYVCFRSSFRSSVFRFPPSYKSYF